MKDDAIKENKPSEGFIFFGVFQRKYVPLLVVSKKLLENKKDAWIRVQCFHCDFDLRFDKPAPKQATAYEQSAREIQELMNQQNLSSQQLHEMQAARQQQMAKQSGLSNMYGQGMANMSYSEVEHRQREYNERMRHMVDAAQYQAFPPTIIDPFAATSAPPPKKHLDLGVDIDEEVFKRMREG